MTEPFVSIIIPVAAAHRDHAATAVASCRWQTVSDFEVIIANDTGLPLHALGEERIRVIDAPPHWPGQSHASMASAARNAGLEVARGVFTIYLDADDYLLPTAIETFTRGHATHEAAYSYGHHYGLGRLGGYVQSRPPEYVQSDLSRYNPHPITAFAPTACLRDVGGCDEDAPGLEDWTVWLRMAIAGWCGQRIYGPTFVYRRDEGINHQPDIAKGRQLMDDVTAPYRNAKGEIPMAGCGCGGAAAAAKTAARQVARTLGSIPMADTDTVTMEYIGRGEGRQSFRHPVSKREYRAGRGPAVRYVLVPIEDVAYLEQELRLFKRVMPAAPFVPPPDPKRVAKDTIAESEAPAPVVNTEKAKPKGREVRA